MRVVGFVVGPIPNRTQTKLNIYLKNNFQVIAARVSTDKPVELSENTPVSSMQFSYSVYWVETEKTLKDRVQLEQHSRGHFFPKSLEVDKLRFNFS